MSTTFPKFSSKSRGGKISDTIPPPHTMRSLGKFDFHVGPHIFPGYFSPSTSTWHTAPYRPSTYTPYTPYGASTTPSAGTYTQRAFTPLVSAVASDTPITPALITRVNDAAATDPILANFLQLAASGRATSDQLKTLALLIQSLAYTPSSTAALGGVSASEALSVLNQLSVQTPSSTPSSSTPATPPVTLAPHTAHEHLTPAQSTVPKEFDLVLEFPERPYDRWLFPRAPVVCERNPSLGDIEAVLLVVALPLPKQKQGATTESATPESSDPPQEVVQFRITKVNQAFWDSLLNWAGGSAKVEANRSVLEKIANPERVYLQHQIPEGDLLTKLQAAALPYSMKSIKPPHGDRGSAKRRAAPRRTGSNAESQGAGNAPKRKRASQPKAGAISKKIACVSCGQADVPLMMGGRFCRPCMDAGKASNEATTGTQDVGITAQPSQPSSQPLSTTVANEQIAGLTVPPLVSSSPLCTNPPLIQSTTDPVTVTSPQPPALNS
ncbi:hypothetical protein EDB83DRAFT_571099 [Lactarius deliciosus]|nr:hypothetical protein EDB83DRAFT_571099 [Lactarius deliciosus]